MREKFHRVEGFQLKRKSAQGRGRASDIRGSPFWPPEFNSA